MKYIITGGNGLIGSELHKRLFKEKYDCVYNIDLKNNRAINDINHMDILPEAQADIMFHLASPVKINRCIKYPALAHRDICDGTFEVLEFCRRNNIPKIVYFSSSRVLSKEKNPYTAGKIYGEELVKGYAQCYGLEYIIIRPSTVYGGKDNSDRLVYKWCQEATRNENLYILGKKSKTLSFTYIDDFIDGVMLTLKAKWNKEYNIGGEEIRLYEVAREIIKQTNSLSKIEYLPREKAQPQIVTIDCKEIKKLGWKHKTSIQQGITKQLSTL